MLNYSSYSEKLEKLKSGELSLTDNVKFFLEQANSKKSLNIFNTLFNDSAIEQAKIVESKIKAGTAGKLAGMVIAVKDNLAIENQSLTCSSKILENFTSVYTATSVKNLIDEDAIIIGKTNCDEFAMGSSNENSYFGPVKNPLDETKVPGGSSGGSAAAVAANLCDVAIGSDTGGSIRQPASFCGIVGLKPTYSAVSRYGLTAFASSFDCVGPLSKNVSDSALVLSVMQGLDENDTTSTGIDNFSYEDLKADKSLSVGLPEEYFAEGLDKEVKASIEKIIKALEDEGVEIKKVALPNTEYNISTYYILTTAEASSNLARFDGARYGYRSQESKALKDMYENSRAEGFGSEVKRRIMLGTYVLSAGYYDAYYKKAQKVRRLIKEDFDNAFNEVDILLAPATPTKAFGIGENIDDPLTMYLNDIYTLSANLAGIPAISIPIKTNDLPVGVQLMGKHFQEEKLLSFSLFVEKVIQNL